MPWRLYLYHLKPIMQRVSHSSRLELFPRPKRKPKLFYFSCLLRSWRRWALSKNHQHQNILHKKNYYRGNPNPNLTVEPYTLTIRVGNSYLRTCHDRSARTLVWKISNKHKSKIDCHKNWTEIDIITVSHDKH